MNLRAVDNHVWRDGLDADTAFGDAVGKLVEVWVNLVGRTSQAQMHLIKVDEHIIIQQEGVDCDHEPIGRAQHIHLILLRVAAEHEGEEDNRCEELAELHSCRRLGSNSQEARRSSRTHKNTRDRLPYVICKVQGCVF